MILGIGTDIVDILRFSSWQTLPNQRLTKIFSEQELADCFAPAPTSYHVEKLAIRFAAKEAFYKAISALLVRQEKTEQTFSFLVTCSHVQMQKSVWDTPLLKVDWDFFQKHTGVQLHDIQVDLSVSHEKKQALAFVVLSK